MGNPYHDKRGRFSSKTAADIVVGDVIVAPDGTQHTVTKLERPGTMNNKGFRPAHTVIHTDTGMRIPKDAQAATTHKYDVISGRNVQNGRVSSSDYGMHYSPDNAKVVEVPRSLTEDVWNRIPVTTIKHGTVLQANEQTLKAKSIDKVVSGAEKFREGYIAKLYQTPNGDLHVVDGHHRVAMYHALGKDMPARVLKAPASTKTLADGLADQLKRRKSR